MEERTYYSISEINEIVHELFHNIPAFQSICLKGEISNFKGANNKGHLYFTLKDANSSINASLFKYDSYSLTFQPKNGDEVIVTGSLELYKVTGSYQIIIKTMELCGEGALLLKKKQLKEKLFKAGYFDAEHKKTLPKYPEHIAVITGKNSAAALDFEYNLNRRWPLAEVDIIPSLVQGEEASKELIKHLKECDKGQYDVIIIGRGGGAIEDLNAFDDEELVKTIFDLNTPIISAVGHQINQSLCDLTADYYASTPTGAAEIAVPNIDEVLDDLEQEAYSLYILLNRKIENAEAKFLNLKNKKILIDLGSKYESQLNKLELIKEKLNRLIELKIKKYEFDLEKLKSKTNLLNVTEVLNKGYSIIYSDKDEIITDIKKIEVNSNLKIKTKDGTLKVKVEDIEYGK